CTTGETAGTVGRAGSCVGGGVVLGAAAGSDVGTGRGVAGRGGARGGPGRGRGRGAAGGGGRGGGGEGGGGGPAGEGEKGAVVAGGSVDAALGSGAAVSGVSTGASRLTVTTPTAMTRTAASPAPGSRRLRPPGCAGGVASVGRVFEATVGGATRVGGAAGGA